MSKAWWPPAVNSFVMCDLHVASVLEQNQVHTVRAPLSMNKEANR